MRVGLAFRAFWVALFSREKGAEIERILQASQATLPSPRISESKSAHPSETVEGERAKPKVDRALRSDALTLLSSLQREARFIDLVQESLEGYSDAQVGAAARDVLRDSKKVLDRIFSIGPVLEQDEGERIAIPSDASALRYRITGRSTGATQGTLVHRGWQANLVQLPQWTGAEKDANVLAPVEIEVP